MRWLAQRVVPLVVLLAGCGDDGSVGDAGGDGGIDADVGTDASTPDGSVPPMPTPAALPTLTPCPSGWLEVADEAGRPTLCEPYGSAGVSDCVITEAHLPGASACTPVTSPCPSDGWPDDVPEPAVVHVRADAGAGGDGTRGAPFQTIAEGIAAAPEGAAIAIAPGSYGPTVVDRDVSLRGACAEVVLSPSDASPALRVDGANVTVDDLRISGGGASVGLEIADSTVTISRVIVDDLRDVGIDIARSAVNASDVRFHDIGDRAIYIVAGSELIATRLAFTGTIELAIRSDGSTSTVSDSVFQFTGSEPEAFHGERGSGMTFERIAIVGDGAMLLFRDTTLTLRSSAILGLPSATGSYSNALVAFEESRIVVERTSIRRIWSVALAAADPLSMLDVSDVVIRGDAEGAVLHAVEVGEGAEASLSRLFVGEANAIAVLATDDGSIITAEDLVIAGTQSTAGGLLGRALQIQRGARLSAERVHLWDNREVAVVAGALGAHIDLRDAVIERTRARGCVTAGCAGAGIGLGAYLDGTIAVSRFLLSDNALAGAQLAQDGAIELTDGVVSGSPVGVNVQVPDYDIGRLTANVLFRDNDINLDSEELPVPAATAR